MHGTEEQSEAIARTIDNVKMNTGIKISRVEALHLMAGGKSCLTGNGAAEHFAGKY